VSLPIPCAKISRRCKNNAESRKNIRPAEARRSSKHDTGNPFYSSNKRLLILKANGSIPIRLRLITADAMGLQTEHSLQHSDYIAQPNSIHRPAGGT
jgi:hypothetical protein